MRRVGKASAAIVAVLVLGLGGSQLSAESGSSKGVMPADKDGGINILSVAGETSRGF
jgi:hypothetical protein